VSRSSTLDLESLWSESLESVMPTVSSPAQRQWLAATRPVGFSEDTVVLASPHSFAREWLDARCGERIREALSEAAGRSLMVVITVQPHPEPLDDLGEARSEPPREEPSPGAERSAPTEARYRRPVDEHADAGRFEATRTATSPGPERAVSTENGWYGGHQDRGVHERGGPLSNVEERPLHAPGRPAGPTVSLPEPRPAPREDVEHDTQLNPKYSFDDFVIGSSNRFAHAAAVAVSEAPAKSYNPLFVYGGAGLGKTHLLHAIGHYVRSLYPRLAVRYLTTEQFTNEFINAIRDDRITSFQRTYRQTDVLLIDDIQFLENKERTQEEFFHTFNALHNAEKQIVISSDRPPKQIAHLEDRMRRRL
jgi:chromosomal replication initiator protein